MFRNETMSSTTECPGGKSREKRDCFAMVLPQVREEYTTEQGKHHATDLASLVAPHEPRDAPISAFTRVHSPRRRALTPLRTRYGRAFRRYAGSGIAR